MSSVSCVMMKSSSTAGWARDDKPDEHNMMSAIMWTLGSLLVSFNVEMSNNNSGILVSVTVANVLIMLLATVLLGKGLKDSNTTYVLPWLVLSFWTMYQIQMRDIIKLYLSLSRFKVHNYLPWLSLLAYCISLIIRFHLTMSVAYIALQQWYNKKLYQEVKESLETKAN